MKTPLVQERFDGGMSVDLKLGAQHSFYYARHFDFRKSPTQMTILPATVKETSTTVTDLITDMVRLPSGKIVAIGDAGGVYSRSTAGTWTKNGTTLPNTTMGMVYNEQQDTIYVPGTSTLHSITNADLRFSGGAFTVNANAISAILDQSATSSASTYTTTGVITETSVNQLSVTPTIEPLYSLKVWVTTKGTGDLVVTMHDSANNILATKTVANGSLVNGQLNEFVFTTPVRTTVKPNGATYHFHITHPSGTASTIGVATLNDLSTARYETYASRLVQTVNGMHPVIDFLQYICIGNGRYLAVWEPISQSAPSVLEFQQHRLVFPSGYEVCGLALYTEYLAMACEKRSSSAANEFQEGKIIFWDGTSTTYNFIIDVPEGSPFGLFSHKNVLYYFAGGAWWAWSGGDPVKLKQMNGTDFEYTDLNTYIVNYPHTMTVRNGILLGGFPSETNSATIEHGIYSFGARDRNFPESFGYSYTMSTGTRTNGTLRIGAIKNLGDRLFMSWRDGSSYGVDIVDPNSNPFTAATWESLVLDDGRPDRTKQADEMVINFIELPAGCTITPKYKIDREADWQTGTAAVAGETTIKLNINKRYKEIQLGIDAVATTATPTVTGVTLIRDMLANERD